MKPRRTPTETHYGGQEDLSELNEAARWIIRDALECFKATEGMPDRDAMEACAAECERVAAKLRHLLLTHPRLPDA